jgi:hypothetical protein
VLNVPIYALICMALFGDWSDGHGCGVFLVLTDLAGLLRGETDEDVGQHAKVLVFLLLCTLMVIGESGNIHRNHPGLDVSADRLVGADRSQNVDCLNAQTLPEETSCRT